MASHRRVVVTIAHNVTDRAEVVAGVEELVGPVLHPLREIPLHRRGDGPIAPFNERV
jgi:hypothetical protein